MKKMRILIFPIILISIFSIGAIVYALSPSVHFDFRTVGQWERVSWQLNAGTHRLTTNLWRTGNATLGLSLERNTLLGWSFIGRCNPNVQGRNQVVCNWTNQSSGQRRGTVVLDSNPGGAIV